MASLRVPLVFAKLFFAVETRFDSNFAPKKVHREIGASLKAIVIKDNKFVAILKNTLVQFWEKGCLIFESNFLLLCFNCKVE